MYLDSVTLANLRTFHKPTRIDLVHPDSDFAPAGFEGNGQLPRPHLPNVNLLLGDNGSGKTTILKAVALAGFGPAVADAKVGDNYLVRKVPGRLPTKGPAEASVRAALVLHGQDGGQGLRLDSNLAI